MSVRNNANCLYACSSRTFSRSFLETVHYWFALKVFFNKVLELEAELKKMSVECYYPATIEEKILRGKKVCVKKPAVNSLLFFKGSLEEAQEIQKRFEGRAMLFTYRLSRQPAIIPDREMRIFQLVTDSREKDLDYLDADAVNFKTGQHVRVTGGIFQGAEGYIKRIRGNKRLIVAIEGVVAVATSYIPSCYLEPIPESGS